MNKLKDTLLKVSNLAVSFDTVDGPIDAVQGINFELKKGQTLAIIGESGSGKSTLIDIIMAIMHPTNGNIEVNGLSIYDSVKEWQKQIGYVSQNIYLLPDTIKNNIGFGIPEDQIDDNLINEVVKKTSLKNFVESLEFGVDTFIGEGGALISGGQKQRIGIARALYNKPKLLIFDEPFSGFDPINANLIKDEILQLRDEGSTIIFSTHRMESVEELCDDIALIHESKKILEGKLDDIKRDYKTNTFEVGLMTERSAALKQTIDAKFKVSNANFKSLNNDLKLNISLGANQTPNDLLAFLTAQAQVLHFKELIPNASDIFIQTIKNN